LPLNPSSNLIGSPAFTVAERNNPGRIYVQQERFQMKFITAWSTAAFVLVPAIGLAQENGTGNTKQEEPGIVNKVIEKITGRSPQDSDKSVDANKQDANKTAESTDKSQGSRDYPDFNAIKKTN
jgi:hypothetical protein